MRHRSESRGRAPLRALVVGAVAAVATTSVRAHAQSSDTAFSAMQARGAQTMGVDQATSTHRFEPLPDGGRIVLVRDAPDSAGAERIRAHLRALRDAFAAGDFSMPMFIHMQTVPGATVMAERRHLIRYTESDLPNGGALRIETTDPAAVAAVRAFLAFQRGAHRTSSGPPAGQPTGRSSPR